MAKRSTLGSYIRFLRNQNKMTQAQLADKVGVTDKAVSKWERDLSYPDTALFPKLADILGVTVNDLLKECIDESHPSRLLRIFGMSHDIRTPIHIILGCANMAGIHRDDPKRLEHYLESIRVSGEYLLKTVDRLMQVANEEEDGSFESQYPSSAEELGDYLKSRTETGKEAAEGFDFTGKRILVAEDILVNREIAAEILRQTGARTEFAEDGEECLRMVENAPPGYYDLILMDIMMPKMDGVEATRRIRGLKDPEKARIPIIALSADVYEKDRQAAFEAGMNAFADKPVIVHRLLKTLKLYL